MQKGNQTVLQLLQCEREDKGPACRPRTLLPGGCEEVPPVPLSGGCLLVRSCRHSPTLCSILPISESRDRANEASHSYLLRVVGVLVPQGHNLHHQHHLHRHSLRFPSAPPPVLLDRLSFWRH